MESIIDTLITDRTAADVQRVRYLNYLWDARAGRWTGTPEEWEEWAAGPRGAYGFADMNRVEEAISYLIGRLGEAGYAVADAGDVVPAFNVRVSADPAGGGEIGGGGVFYRGDTATVHAAPSGKHDFVGWMEDGAVVSASPSYTFTVERSRNLTAVFALKKYTVTVSTNPTNSGEISGGGMYDVDTVVIVSVQAGEGWAFTRWTRDGEMVGEGPEYSFVLEGDTSLVAVMTKLHVISVSAGEDDGGTVSGSGTYLDGQFVTAAAVAGEGWAFTGWRENGVIVSTDEVYTFTANGDRTLTAEFVRLYTVTLLVEPDDGGEADGAGVYRAGESVTISATAEDGRRFVEWLKDGECVGTGAEYTFIVSGDTTLTARFEAIPVYTISVGVLPGQEELGTVTGAGDYREGAAVTVKSEAADGYVFSAWQEGGETVSENAEYTFTVTGPRVLEAVFKKFSRLPDGYTEVEYIQSNGYQYINTGIIPRVGGSTTSQSICRVKLSVDIEPLDAPTSTVKRIAYSVGTVAAGNTTYSYIFAISWQTPNGAYATLAKTNTSSAPNATASAVEDATPRRMRLELIGKGSEIRTFSVDGEEVSFTAGNTGYPPNQNSITLFGPSGTATTNKIRAKLYSCKIYTGTDLPLFRDFVPCIAPTGAVGLYDLVEGKFYANSGTGTFTAGPAV